MQRAQHTINTKKPFIVSRDIAFIFCFFPFFDVSHVTALYNYYYLTRV